MPIVQAWKWPDSYLGASWHGYYSSGFGRTRDSDALEESNFEIASRKLLALQSFVPDTEEPDGERESVTIVSENHWAVGWIEWIAIDRRNIQAYQCALELCAMSNNYPPLDEEHFCNLEYNRAMEFWDSMSLASKVRYCHDCSVSIFVARRNHDLPDRLLENLTCP